MGIPGAITSCLPSILIIDDDASMLELYERTLNNEYHVHTCSRQSEAREILSTHHPKLVVLEPAIQGFQGWEIFREIRDNYETPVIVCSAVDDRKKGLEAGALAYLVKPVLPMTLLEVLRSVFKQSASLQE